MCVTAMSVAVLFFHVAVPNEQKLGTNSVKRNNLGIIGKNNENGGIYRIIRKKIRIICFPQYG